MFDAAELSAWLRHLETAHDRKIDLGLERVGAVYAALQLAPVAPVVITVAGTNGKGSTVAMLDAICQAAGYKTGRFTSPHLLRYNERIVINGQEATDSAIVSAFRRIEEARGHITLSYFEYTTLAALYLFKQAAVDVAILEVGLGGRLDSVNVVDTDCALITTVDIDHTQWLGDNRESVGREKSGIFRPGRPAVCGDPDCPLSVRRQACQRGARLYRRDIDFDIRLHDSGFDWLGWHRDILALPLPSLPGVWQCQNAATAVAALESLRERLPIPEEAYGMGLHQARLPGRLQQLRQQPEIRIDVAHNAQAAAALACWLKQNPSPGKTVAVLGVLADKNAHEWLGQFRFLVDAWVATQPVSERALPVAKCAELIRKTTGAPLLAAHTDPLAACHMALTGLDTDDRLLVFGSFFVLEPVIREFA